MPSHLHLILKPENGTIGDIVQDFGSYTAYAILKIIKANQELGLLQFFHDQRRDNRRQHSIWQDIQAKNIYS
jgi:REP element-mobilizing transposase RayT